MKNAPVFHFPVENPPDWDWRSRCVIGDRTAFSETSGTPPTEGNQKIEPLREPPPHPDNLSFAQYE